MRQSSRFHLLTTRQGLCRSLDTHRNLRPAGGDKVDVIEAAASLGTDEEAAGTPPSCEVVAQTRKQGFVTTP